MSRTNERTTCTAQAANGNFCNRTSLPDAPFPICVMHAARIFAFLQGSVLDKMKSSDVCTDAVKAYAATSAAAYRMAGYEAARPVVYYVKVMTRIKIGTTNSLRDRILGYPPGSEVLAVEPGDRHLESRRLDQFWEYRVAGREWFSPGEKLMEHISKLQAKYDIDELAKPSAGPKVPLLP